MLCVSARLPNVLNCLLTKPLKRYKLNSDIKQQQLKHVACSPLIIQLYKLKS